LLHPSQAMQTSQGLAAVNRWSAHCCRQSQISERLRGLQENYRLIYNVDWTLHSEKYQTEETVSLFLFSHAVV
jgi:hypothetical protein